MLLLLIEHTLKFHAFFFIFSNLLLKFLDTSLTCLIIRFAGFLFSIEHISKMLTLFKSSVDLLNDSKVVGIKLVYTDLEFSFSLLRFNKSLFNFS